MTLRIVRDEPQKPPRRRARRDRVFNADEERALRAALRTLKGSHTWETFAAWIGMSAAVLEGAVHGRFPVSAEMAIRAARVARKPLEELLSPVPRRVA